MLRLNIAGPPAASFQACDRYRCTELTDRDGGAKKSEIVSRPRKRTGCLIGE